MTSDQLGIGEIKPDISNLYREENYTDGKVASIRKMVPVKADGTEDEARDAYFVGQTSIMLPTGPLPINCEIEAGSIEDAFKKFPDAIRKAVDEMIDRAQKMQQEEAKRIVTPDELGGGKGGLII